MILPAIDFANLKSVNTLDSYFKTSILFSCPFRITYLIYPAVTSIIHVGSYSKLYYTQSGDCVSSKKNILTTIQHPK